MHHTQVLHGGEEAVVDETVLSGSHRQLSQARPRTPTTSGYRGDEPRQAMMFCAVAPAQWAVLKDHPAAGLKSRRS
jgi:hypothetical protein